MSSDKCRRIFSHPINVIVTVSYELREIYGEQKALLPEKFPFVIDYRSYLCNDKAIPQKNLNLVIHELIANSVLSVSLATALQPG